MVALADPDREWTLTIDWRSVTIPPSVTVKVSAGSVRASSAIFTVIVRVVPAAELAGKVTEPESG